VIQLNCVTLITPQSLTGATILAVCLILAELFLILYKMFLHFRYHGNRGLSEVNFNDTIKLLDLEYRLSGATFVALSLELADPT